MRDLGYIIYPFHVLIKAFEEEKCRQYKAVPYYTHLEKYLSFLSQQPQFSQYSTIFVELQTQIDFRKRKTLHWELLCAAYSLTYQGRIWLRKKIAETNPTSVALNDEESEFREKVPDLVYKQPISLPENEEQSDHFTETLISSLEDSIQNQEIIDFMQLAIPPAEFIPPTHDLGLFKIIIETLKEAAKKIGQNPDDIDSTFNDYIYNRILQKTEPIAKLFPELSWNSYAMIPKMMAIVNVATRLLLAKASEACVERYFSKQKLVLNYLRLRSKEDLLNARFQLRE